MILSPSTRSRGSVRIPRTRSIRRYFACTALLLAITTSHANAQVEGRVVGVVGVEAGLAIAETITDDDPDDLRRWNVGPSGGLRVFIGGAVHPLLAIGVSLRTGGGSAYVFDTDVAGSYATWWTLLGPSVRLLPGDDSRGLYASATFGLSTLLVASTFGTGFGGELEIGYAIPLSRSRAIGVGLSFAATSRIARGHEYDFGTLESTHRSFSPSFVVSYLPRRHRIERNPSRPRSSRVSEPARAAGLRE